MIDTSVLLDGSLGAFVGAVITGAAQLWSYRLGKKDARQALSITAAQQLLDVVYSANKALFSLPLTEAALGSPLSYAQRLGNSLPTRESLDRARFSQAPLLTDPNLQRAFIKYFGLLRFVSGTSVDDDKIFAACREVERYGDYVRDYLVAHIDGSRAPAEPTITMPAMRTGRTPELT